MNGPNKSHHDGTGSRVHIFFRVIAFFSMEFVRRFGYSGSAAGVYIGMDIARTAGLAISDIWLHKQQCISVACQKGPLGSFASELSGMILGCLR